MTKAELEKKIKHAEKESTKVRQELTKLYTERNALIAQRLKGKLEGKLFKNVGPDFDDGVQFARTLEIKDGRVRTCDITIFDSAQIILNGEAIHSLSALEAAEVLTMKEKDELQKRIQEKLNPMLNVFGLKCDYAE